MNEESPIAKAINTIGSMALSRVAIFAAVLTAGYYFLMYDDGSMILANIESAKSQLEVENNKKIETQKVLKKEQAMKADVELVVKKFEEIKSKIPIEFSESELRSIIDSYANQNGLKTAKSDRRGSYQAPSNDENEKLVEQVGLNYEFVGNYSNISKFVLALSQSEKLIKISDFSMVKQNISRAGPVKDQSLIFRVSIIGFKQSLEALKGATEKKVQ